MQLTLILDKSAFQSLSYAEIYRLCQYYVVIIAPILVTEILGDLSKEAREGNTPDDKRVIGFARKLFINESVVIMDYRKIVHMDLVNHNISLDRRPIVDINKTSRMGDQVGFEIKESDEEKSIRKWKEGEFTDAERVLSKEWRTLTTEPFALDKLKQKYNHQKYGLNSLSDVLTKVDSILNDPSLTEQLLYGLFENYEIPARDASEILQNWRKIGKPLLRNFSLYSYHCLRVDLLFIIGLNENLIGTRSTNAVDLKYLYHLPFAKIFSSNDNFHKLIVPLLLEEDQIFIEGQELKKDISQLLQCISELDENERKEFYKNPPIDENSFTYNLWKEFYGYNTGLATWQVKPSEKEIDAAKKHMNKILDTFDRDAENNTDIENADYIVRHSVIKADDPCFCKSGNNLVGCCMTSEQFAIESEVSYLRDIQSGKILPNDGTSPPSYEEIEEIINGLKNGTIKPRSH